MPYTNQAGSVTTVSRSFVPEDDAFIWVSHQVSTSYQEAISVVEGGNARAVASRYDRRAGRMFNITFTLLWYLPPSVTVDDHLNLRLLEQFYQSHSCAKAFKYIHPIYGKLSVRFSAPLMLPAAQIGGRGSVAGLTVQLQELVADDHPFSRDTNYTSTIFNYPNHTVATTYPLDAGQFTLGQNYQFAVKNFGSPERTFSLTFSALAYYYDHDDNINPLANPSMNVGNLELMYHQHRTTGTFQYTHPILGVLTVRFKSPPNIPSTTGPHAAVLGVTVELLEVL